MAQFNIAISGGSAPYVVSVKKSGDNTERWISGGTSGSGVVIFTSDNGNFTYNVNVSKAGCTTVVDNFNLNCNIAPPCVSLSNVQIVGNQNLQLGTTSNYSFTYQGTAPTSVTWSVSNGTLQSNANLNTASVLFNTLGIATISLSVTNCNGTITVNLPITVSQTQIVCNEYIFFNGSLSDEAYTYQACNGNMTNGTLLAGDNVILCIQGMSDTVVQGNVPIQNLGGITVSNAYACGTNVNVPCDVYCITYNTFAGFTLQYQNCLNQVVNLVIAGDPNLNITDSFEVRGHSLSLNCGLTNNCTSVLGACNPIPNCNLSITISNVIC